MKTRQQTSDVTYYHSVGVSRSAQLLSLIVLTWRLYNELPSIARFVELVHLLECAQFYFFCRLQGTKKLPILALLLFFGTLYCSNCYSIKSKPVPVPVVITVINNNIVAVPSAQTRSSVVRQNSHLDVPCFCRCDFAIRASRQLPANTCALRSIGRRLGRRGARTASLEVDSRRGMEKGGRVGGDDNGGVPRGDHDPRRTGIGQSARRYDGAGEGAGGRSQGVGGDGSGRDRSQRHGDFEAAGMRRCDAQRRGARVRPPRSGPV